MCQGGKSALVKASEKGHAAVVNVLISYGVDVDFRSNVSNSLLCVFAFYRSLYCMCVRDAEIALIRDINVTIFV